jgi:hypothetical protein
MALEQLRRAAFLEPNQAMPQIGMAQAFLGLRQHTRALGALRQASSILFKLESDQKPWGTEQSIQELQQLVANLLEQIEVKR